MLYDLFVSFSRLGLILLYRMVEKTFQFLILLIENILSIKETDMIMKSRTFFILVFIFLVSLGCFSCKTTATDDFLLIRKLRIAGLRLCGRWFLFLR